MKRCLGLLIALLVLIAPQVRAAGFVTQKQDAGQAGAFLNYAASARSLGMGRAFTGVADDAAATYWNASGLSQIKRKDMVTLYSVLEENTNFGFFSYAQPSLDYGTFGLSVVNLRSSNFERREAVTGNAIGSYDMSETAFLFSNGIRTSDKLAVGSTLKIIRQQIDTNSGMGYGLDMSSLYSLNSKFKLGFVMNNLLAPSMKLSSEKETYARELRAGVQFIPRGSWMVSTDFVKSQNRSLKMNFGTEVPLNAVVAIRAGLTASEITMGLGFKMGDWNLDYALGRYDNGSSDTGFGSTSHRFGLHLKFGSDVNDSGQSLRWANKGHECLEALAVNMSTDTLASDPKLQDLLEQTAEVIKNRGYSNAQDLYAAQAYISYFKGEYERSVQSFSEAAALDADNKMLADNLAKARAKMTAEGIAKAIDEEMVALKKSFDEQDWRAAITSSKKILSLQPDHIEAAAYLDDAEHRLNEPIQRAMKIARAKFDRQEYLDTIKSLHEVRKLDPENKEAADLMSKAIDALEKSSAATAISDPHVEEISRDSQKSRESYSKGLQYYSQGKIQDALVAWKDAVRYDTTNTSAQKAYERATLELGERP